MEADSNPHPRPERVPSTTLCPGGCLLSPFCLPTDMWAALGTQNGRREGLPDVPVISSLDTTLPRKDPPFLYLLLRESLLTATLGSW